MAETFTFAPVTTFTNDSSAVATVNANYQLIATALNNVLDRYGTSPNSMQAVLDMNSFNIVNLPGPATINSPVRLVDVIAPGIALTVPPVGTSGSTVPLLNGVNTWSGSQTFTTPVNFQGFEQSTQPSITTLGVTTVDPSFYVYNYINLTNQNAFIPNNGAALMVRWDANGTNSGGLTGGANFAIVGEVNVRTTITNSGTGWCGVAGLAVARTPISGVSAGGGLFAMNANVQLLANASGYSAIGMESDVTCETGTNPAAKAGFVALLGPTDNSPGTTNDGAFICYNPPGYAGPGWLLGYGPDNTARNSKIISTAGTVFGLRGINQNVANGLDLSLAICSGSIIKGQFCRIRGTDGWTVLGATDFPAAGTTVPFVVHINANNNFCVIGNGANALNIASTNDAGTAQGLSITSSSLAIASPLTMLTYTITGSGTISFAGPNVTGMRTVVTNGTLATGFGNIVTSGGAAVLPVFYDGTNWRYG